MKTNWENKDIEKIRQMYQTHTAKEIAEHLKVSRSTVEGIINRYNIKKVKKKRSIDLMKLLNFDEYTYGR